jgi:peptidoglycan/xylan/chitin deacetylase (PgdA/CDA1 family)
MGRPLIVAALLLCCICAAGSASAQVERDTNSRSRAGYSGVSRDVFTSGRPRGAVEAPEAKFQVSPYLEAAAISLSFSIKGHARELAESAVVPAAVEEPAALPAAEELLASLGLVEPEAEAPAVAELESTADQINRDTVETARDLHEFAEFPDEEGGTLHDPGLAEDAAGTEMADDGVEPQLDLPAFLDDEAAPGDSRPLLSAEGKGALAFDDETLAFALPDGVLAPSADPAGAGGFDLHAGVLAPDWTSVTIPRSVTELSRGNQRQRLVALTFDDGPHPEYTEQLLAILKYYDVPATFFFVGIQCVKYPQLVQQAYEDGFEIGSQTYDHFRMPNLPREEKEYQIDEYQLLIKRLTGSEPRFMRPPGGQVDDQTKSLLRERGIVLALWDVALNDTRDGKTAAEMLETAKARVRPGSVILAHDGIRATVELLPQLIEELRREGYEFVTMSELAAGL